MKPRICPDCEREYFRPGPAKRCYPCSIIRVGVVTKAWRESVKSGNHKPRVRHAALFQDLNKIAHALVARAVSYGFLLPASDLNCADCGAPATGYDHRDYNKPLDVEPVCMRCNNLRGPGIPMVLPTRKEEP